MERVWGKATESGWAKELHPRRRRAGEVRGWAGRRAQGAKGGWETLRGHVASRALRAGRGGRGTSPKTKLFEEKQIYEESRKKGGRENRAEALHGYGISSLNVCSWQRQGCRRRAGAWQGNGEEQHHCRAPPCLFFLALLSSLPPPCLAEFILLLVLFLCWTNQHCTN